MAHGAITHHAFMVWLHGAWRTPLSMHSRHGCMVQSLIYALSAWLQEDVPKMVRSRMHAFVVWLHGAWRNLSNMRSYIVAPFAVLAVNAGHPFL
eukprot:365021-Chlamydomonas_euryale.AAC.7